MDMLINLIVGVVSKCIYVSNHRVVHYKYITVLFVNYASIKLEKKFFKNKESYIGQKFTST